MHFLNNFQVLGKLPNYLIGDFLELAKAITPTFKTVDRAVLCPNNSLLYLRSLDGQALLTANACFSKAISYLYPFCAEFLEEKIPIERAMCASKKTDATEKFYGRRFIERVGEKVIIPLTGAATYTFYPRLGEPQEFQLKVGEIIRVNDRINTSFKTDALFVAAVINFLDIDLDHFLTAQDKQAIFELAIDEG